MDFPGLMLDLSSLSERNAPDPETTYDVIVLGGGPAAMAAAVYDARKMLKVALVAKDFGGQVATTSLVENYLGFQSIDGKELVDRFVEHVRGFDLPVAKGEQVRRVTRSGELFHVELESGTSLSSRTVILATGKRDRPLDVPGEKELVGRGVAYCATCDAPFFKEKDVVVAGGGNSAFTAALDLLRNAARVTLVNFARGWQADAVLDGSVRKSGSATLLDHHQVTRIDGTDRVTAVHVRDRATGAERAIPADGIFIEIGLLPNSDPVKGLAELNPGGEVIVDSRCRTSVPGLFAAGDVTDVPYKQILVSAGEGVKASLAAYDYLVEKGLV